MLTAATKIAPWHASQTILTNMRLSEVLQDKFSFAAITRSITGYDSYDSLEGHDGHDGHDALWQQAVQHLAGSISFRITLDVAAYNAVMNACAVCGEWWCVLQLLKSMRASQIQADQLSYDALATSLTKQSRMHWEQVLSLMEKNIALQSSPSQSLKLLPQSSWAFALQIFDSNSMWTMRLHSAHSWQLAFHASSEMPKRVVHEACHQRGWQWTVSALAASLASTVSIESTKAQLVRLVSLTSLASAFSIANIWESVFICIEKLQQPGHNAARLLALFYHAIS
jgi:hypothetical protein